MRRRARHAFAERTDTMTPAGSLDNAGCCTVGADHGSAPQEGTTPAALSEIRFEETPPDVAAIRAAGFKLLLETGRPVAVEELTAAVDLPPGRVAEILETVGGRGRVEFDDRGRLIGLAGLTLTPGRHELALENATLWAWCALDSVGILGALEATGAVRSTDPHTGETIEIAFTEGRPDTDTHLFILGGYTEGNIREDWCPQVNFFTSRRAADEWAGGGGLQGDVVAVADIAEDAAAMWRPVVDLDAPQVC